MKSVFRTAVEVDELIERNRCRVDNASPRPKQQSKPERVVPSVTHEYRDDGKLRKKGYGWYHARLVIGMPTLHLHWLRHWASTVWDEAGTPGGLRRTIMGHVQRGMTGLYTHPDTIKAVPYAIRVSELAGWPRPATAASPPVVAPAGALAKLLGGLDQATLAVVLASMTGDEVRDLIPLLPPDKLASVLASRLGEQR